MKTTDNVTVKTGALIWYVNYFGAIVPTIFKQKGKSTVVYYSLYENAEKLAQKIRATDCVYERQKILKNASTANTP